MFDSEFMELNVTDWIEGKKKKLKPAKVCPSLLLTEEKQQMTFSLFFFHFLPFVDALTVDFAELV